MKKGSPAVGTTNAEVKINLNGENVLVTVESLERTIPKQKKVSAAVSK